MNNKTLKELRRINNSIPDELKKGILKRVRVLDGANTIYERLKEEPETNPEIFRKLSILKEGGYLDEMEDAEDTDITAKIDAYLQEQIDRSIKLGRLPKKEEKLLTKSKKYARKSTK